MSLATETIASLRRQLQAGDISSRDIITSVAEAIESKDGDVGAYLSHDLDAALAEETRLGLEVIRSGETQQGAQRFSAGAGRHGRFE